MNKVVNTQCFIHLRGDFPRVESHGFKVFHVLLLFVGFFLGGGVAGHEVLKYHPEFRIPISLKFHPQNINSHQDNLGIRRGPGKAIPVHSVYKRGSWTSVPRSLGSRPCVCPLGPAHSTPSGMTQACLDLASHPSALTSHQQPVPSQVASKGKLSATTFPPHPIRPPSSLDSPVDDPCDVPGAGGISVISER